MSIYDLLFFWCPPFAIRMALWTILMDDKGRVHFGWLTKLYHSMIKDLDRWDSYGVASLSPDAMSIYDFTLYITLFVGDAISDYDVVCFWCRPFVIRIALWTILMNDKFRVHLGWLARLYRSI